MDYKLSIYFSNGKDLTIVLKDDEFNRFVVNMANDMAYFNEDKKSGFGVPLYNVMYYTFAEYTEEMKKLDLDRIKESQEAALKSEKAQKDAAKTAVKTTPVEPAIEGKIEEFKEPAKVIEETK